jgi:plastocyanin
MKSRSSRVAQIASVAAVLLASCGSATPGTPARTPPSATAAATSRGPNEVFMSLIAYRPETLKVAAGTTVTWTQQDAGFHTVTSGTADVDASGGISTNPDGMFRSGRLAQGERFEFAFEDPGTYRYFCEIHPATMRAVVEV